MTFPLQANEEEKLQNREQKCQETRKRKEKKSVKQHREQRRREATGGDKYDKMQGRKEVWLLPGAAEDERTSSIPDCKATQEKAVASSRVDQMNEAEVHSSYALTTNALCLPHFRMYPT